MDIYLRAKEFGIPDQDSRDPTEMALEVVVRDDGAGELLEDLGKVGSVRFIVDTPYQAAVLNELGCRNVRVREEMETLGKPLGVDELFKLVETLTWVVPAPGVNAGCLGNGGSAGGSPQFLFSSKSPQRGDLFRHTVTMFYGGDGKTLAIHVDGRPSDVLTTGRRFYHDLVIKLGKVAIAPKGSTTSQLQLLTTPPDTSNGQTTLGSELAHLDVLRRYRLHGYEPPRGRLPNAIFSILLSDAEEGVKLSGPEEARLANLIGAAVAKKKPVTIAISFAVATRIPNPLKFRESVQLPTYAWLYLGWFFRMIQEKVQRLYEPGIAVVIFDEATLFAELMGLNPQEVERFIVVLERLYEQMGAPIKIVPMETSYFPAEEVARMPATVGSDQIYSVLCSLPEVAGEEGRELMADLYVKRDRDYAALKRRAGALWGRAEGLAQQIARYLAYRKQIGLFKTLLGDHPGVIDACITDKNERLVLDITSPALPNHAMPVVRRDQQGFCRVLIVPEYRIETQFGRRVRLVRIHPREFGASGEPFVFYYEETFSSSSG